MKGVGWTPPGSHKVEMARRAAELGLAEGLDTEQAISKYQELMVRQLCILTTYYKLQLQQMCRENREKSFKN